MSDYIPIDLLRNILARLPIEPVVRCTSVCKSWYELITSQSFISAHLNLSVSNCQNRVLFRFCTIELPKKLVRSRFIDPEEKEQFFVHSDDQTFYRICELETRPVSDFEVYGLVGAINGLFCLADGISGIFLWNPSLRKTLDLEPISQTCPNFNNIGFGFLTSTNTYKVVRILNFRSAIAETKLEIYELGAGIGSWRHLTVENFSYVVDHRSDQVFLNCIVHCTASNPCKVGGDFSNLILTFDMKSDKLGALMIPESLQHFSRVQFTVYKLRESLCVYAPSHVNVFSLWAMKEYGVVESWEKVINIDAKPHIRYKPLYLRKNGEILLAKFRKSVHADDWDLVSYDANNNEVVDLAHSERGSSFYADTYVDSLLLINIPKGRQDSRE